MDPEQTRVFLVAWPQELNESLEFHVELKTLPFPPLQPNPGGGCFGSLPQRREWPHREGGFTVAGIQRGILTNDRCLSLWPMPNGQPLQRRPLR